MGEPLGLGWPRRPPGIHYVAPGLGPIKTGSMAHSTFSIRRHPDGLSGWWVHARIEWGKGSSAAGLARSLPFKTKDAAAAWIREQFPGALISRS
jgi:hypothetical protein